MKIAVDVMGGDLGSAVATEGALDARRALGVDVVLVGDEAELRPELSRRGASEVEVVHAPDVVAMDESPSRALRHKRTSSMRVAVDLVASGDAQAVVSPGNTGAFMAISAHVLKRVPGVDRPAIVTSFPTSAGRPAALLDAGANVDCKPAHLVQFALLGATYARVMQGRERPRVGVLSNGEEPSKGNEVTREAHRALAESAPAELLEYVGYVEGRDVFAGKVDAVVCDGFVGNVVLKACEGFADAARTLITRELATSWRTKIGLAIARPGLSRVVKAFDHREHGGAPLLGIGGVSIVAHGSSDAVQIRNAIRVAETAVRGRLDVEMERALSALSEPTAADQRAV